MVTWLETRIFCAVICLLCPSYVKGQCGTGDLIGDPNPGLRTNTATNGDHRHFLVVGGVTDITCDGVITRWEFYYNGNGTIPQVCHDITFQIWRPVDPAQYVYKLVGENKLLDLLPAPPPCLTNQVLRVDVPAAQQIPVLEGDVIGWSDHDFPDPTYVNERLMSYEEALPGSNQYDQVHILSDTTTCSFTVGDDCPWDSSQAEITVRGYALNAELDPAPGNVVIENLPAQVTIKEREPAGIHVFTVQAHDPEPWTPVVMPPLTYAIVNVQPEVPGLPDLAFAIDVDTGEVTTTMELDFEDVLAGVGGPAAATAPYNVTVEVTGHTHVPVTGTLMVDVEDINEAHTISNLSSVVQVDCSTTAAGQVVFNVTCDDPDYAGTNTNYYNHQYYLMESQPNDDLFEVLLNGQVRTKRDLHDWHGEADVYVLHIAAVDGEFSSGPFELFLDVHNVHFPPSIINLPNSVTVYETDTTEQLIFSPLVAWQYPGANGGTFEIVKEYPQTWTPTFELSNTDNEEVWHVNNPNFDYMSKPEYQVEITVFDTQNIYAENAANLTVEVLWVNQPPEFIEDTYTSNIAEGEPVGTALPDVLLQASDRDIPLGDYLDYTIHGAGSHLFRADNVTHLVYVADEIDNGGDCTLEYNLQVDVFDWEGEIDNATLTVEILDVNDHAPVFNPVEYFGTVAENAAAETVILTVACTDNEDCGQNAQVTYSIPDPVADLYYQIDNGGNLMVKQPINYHEYPTLSFEVLCTDGGEPALSDTAMVHLTITPVNNHEPVFTPDFYNVDLKSDAKAGHVALTVTVYDPDPDEVNSVTYFFFVPDVNFFIGQTSGAITVERMVMPDAKYLLYPMVTDKGSPQYYSDPATVRIDTYYPPSHFVDLHLMMPMAEFEGKKDDFLMELNNLLVPWVIFLDKYIVDKDQTIVTIYAWADNTTTTINDIEKTKRFVHKDDMLSKLRTNLQGDPADILLGPDFAEYQIVEVQPTYSVWIIDTVEGIVTLSFICLLAVILLLLAIYLCKRKGWFCFKRTKVKPAEASSLPPADIKSVYNPEDFSLKYVTPPKTASTNVLVPATRYSIPKTASTNVLVPASRRNSRAIVWENEKNREPLPPVVESE